MSEIAQRRILLVEDESIIGLSTTRQLEKFGYSVATALTGDEAIRKAVEGGFDLVLMDIDLGRKPDGIETSQRILKEREIPIVFVSSHTERDIVSQTECVTSYGYIVKASNIIAYDASIKMALKLFTERRRSDNFARYIKTALDNANEPIFICDTRGDIVFFNKSYMTIQGLDRPEGIQTRFSDYSKEICVFSDSGERLDSDQWASTRSLHGLAEADIVFCVYNRRVTRILANHYTCAPIFDERGAIIGSYVKIGRIVENLDPGLLERIEAQMASPSAPAPPSP